MSLLRNVTNRHRASSLAEKMRSSFEQAAPTQQAATVGQGIVQIAGHLYNSTTDAAPGAAVTVRNAGRPAVANYAAAKGGAILVAGAAGSSAAASTATGVMTTRRLLTAWPLAGGGDLSIDRTLYLQLSPSGRILSDGGGLKIDPAIVGYGLDYDASDQIILPAGLAGAGLAWNGSEGLDVQTTDPIAIVGDAVSLTLAATPALEVSAGGLRVKLDTLAGLERAAGGLRVDLADDSALEIVATGLAVADTIAGGGGLKITSKQMGIDLATNPGLAISANKLSLQATHADNTITASTTNSLTANGHRHAVTASDNPGAAATLLKSSPSGGLTLATIDTTGAATIGTSLQAAAGAFYAGLYGGPGAYYTRIGINRMPTDDQFDLDVAGNIHTFGYFVGKHAIQIKDAKAIFHFDGRSETDVTNGTPTSHRGHAPGPATETGTIRYTRGKFGKARDFVRAGVTNLQSEGGFETGSTAGFSSDSAGGAGYSKTITTEHVFEGSNALLIKLGATGTANIYRNPLAISGSTAYAMTLLIKPVTSGASISGLTAFIGSTYFTPTVNDAGDGWYQVIVSGTSSASPTAVHGIAGLVNGETYAIDNFQLTAGAEAYAFTDIATTASALGYPNLAPRWDAGSITMWIKAYGYAAGGAGLFGIGASLSQWDGYIITDGRIGFRTSGTTLASTGTIQRGKWHHICMTWSSSGKRIYIDGILASSVGAYAYTPQAGNFYIGTMSGSLSNTANAAIDDFALIDREMDASEIRSIYESNAPIFAETAEFQFRAGARVNVWADENGFFVRNATGLAAFAIYNGAAALHSWGGINLADADIMIGDSSRGPYILWDDSAANLKLKDVAIEMYASGTKVLDINTANGINVAVRTDGAATFESQRSYSFSRSGTVYGGMHGYSSAAKNDIYLRAYGTATVEPEIGISAERVTNAAGQTANTYMRAATTNSSAYLQAWADHASGSGQFTVSASFWDFGAAQVYTDWIEIAQLRHNGTITVQDGAVFSLGAGAGAKFGTSASEMIGFHGSAPTIRRAAAAQAAVATTGATNSTPYGFTTAAQANAIVTLVNELRAALVDKGLIKGSA